MSVLKKAIKKVIEGIFPPLCLHCEGLVEKEEQLFCHTCSFVFEPMDTVSRCPYCFKESERKRPCKRCLEEKKWHYKKAVTLELKGAVASLKRKLETGKMPYLAKTAASLMFMQLIELKWDIEIVVPLPLSFKAHYLEGRTYNRLLAKELGKYLGVPYVSSFKRKRIEEQKVLVVGVTDQGEAHGMKALFESGPRRAYFLSVTSEISLSGL